MIGNHEAFRGGPEIKFRDPTDTLWAEFKACMVFGIDPEEHFKKDRMMRAFNTGGVMLHNAVSSMRQYDTEKMREAKRK